MEANAHAAYLPYESIYVQEKETVEQKQMPIFPEVQLEKTESHLMWEWIYSIEVYVCPVIIK